MRPRTHLIAVVAIAAVAVAGGAVAVAAAVRDDTARPPRTTLAGAVARWFDGEPPAGVTAQLRLTTSLVDAGRLTAGTALLAGATGTVHLAADGRARLDVHTARGDAVVGFDGSRLTIYDASANTVYRLDAPEALIQALGGAGARERVDAATVGVVLAALGTQAEVTGPEPGVTAGQPSYAVRLSPRRDAGLLGAVEVVWDAVRGVPLRLAVYAEGRPSPIVELVATEIRYDAVADADLALQPPADARVVDLSPRLDDLRAEAEQHLGDGASAEGLPAVAAAMPFAVRAPGSLVGLPQRTVRAVAWDGHPAALALYGRGLGQLLVVQEAAGTADALAPGGLPQVAIEGAAGWELATALGTVIRVERDGVRYTVAGSVPAVAAESAVRELLAG